MSPDNEMEQAIYDRVLPEIQALFAEHGTIGACNILQTQIDEFEKQTRILYYETKARRKKISEALSQIGDAEIDKLTLKLQPSARILKGKAPGTKPTETKKLSPAEKLKAMLEANGISAAEAAITVRNATQNVNIKK